MRKIALRVHNGQYMCAERGGGYEVIANRNWIESWETFVLIDLGNSKVALQSANGMYVCAEHGGGHEVVANRNWIEGWETFSFIDLGNGRVALQAANGSYVCAEHGGGHEIVANRPAINGWETFTLVQADNRPYTLDGGTIMYFTTNRSNVPIYIKPETTETTLLIPPGGRYDGPIDGIAVPQKMRGKVLKVVDNCNVEVLNDKIIVHCDEVNLSSFGISWDIDIPGSSGVNASIIQKYTGGWLDSSPDPGWNNVVNDSKKPDSVVRREQRDEDREYNDRLSRYDRGEREPGEPPRRRDEMNDPF